VFWIFGGQDMVVENGFVSFVVGRAFLFDDVFLCVLVSLELKGNFTSVA